MNTHMKKSNKMLDYFNYFETSIKQIFCRAIFNMSISCHIGDKVFDIVDDECERNYDGWKHTDTSEVATR